MSGGAIERKWLWSQLPDGAWVGSCPDSSTEVTDGQGRVWTISGPVSMMIWTEEA